MNTKQLRQKILDLAIRGKLVPQDPNDEPASVLLERIRAEKEKLIKEGKIRRDKNDSRGDDKSHYEQLPPGWALVRLGTLGEIGSSKRVFTTELVEDGIPFYRGTEIGALSENKQIKHGLYISEKHYNELIKDSGYPSIGDLLMPSICPDGRIWLVNTAEPFYFKDGRVLWVHFDSEQFDKKYVHLALKAMLIKTFSDIASGSTFAELKIFILKDIEIPLPPLAEQRRIVTAIGSAFTVIDEIEQNKSDLQTAVTAAKNKILSLAIRGKLVPQEPSDEPASVLLECIRAEREQLIKAGKIKRGKADSVIVKSDDNSYYGKLPQGWILCRLRNIGQIIGGGTPSTVESHYWDGGSIPWITPADLSGYHGKYITKGSRMITDNGLSESSAVVLPAGSVLFSSRAPIGYCVISENELCTNQGFKSVVPIITEMSEYIFHFLKAQVEEIRSRASGTTFKEISGSEFGNTIITLPPLLEQQRIVRVIEVAFEQLERIAESLN